MKFLVGGALTRQIRDLLCGDEAAKLAIAYWGEGALDLLGLKPHRENVQVLCCLRNGKSDPKIIKRFGKRARQNDSLHAKVVWTPKAAIVSSANASSNGLPEEENQATSLIEAGVFLDDPACVAQIGAWFDTQYRRARSITARDLENAQAARNERIWDGSTGGVRARSFIEAIKDGKKEFLKQRIALVFGDPMSEKRQTIALKWIKENQERVREQLSVPNLRWKTLFPFENFRLPSDSFLISVEREGKSLRLDYPYKTLHKPISGKGCEFAFRDSSLRFPYRITRKEYAVFGRAYRTLKKMAYQKRHNGVLSLETAAPILIGFVK